MPEPERRRRRPAVSCTLCRKRKIRCNRELPCNNCLRSSTGTCVYSGQQQPHQHQRQPRLRARLAETDELREPVGVHYATPQDSTSSGPTTDLESGPFAACFAAKTLASRLPSQTDEVEALRSRIKELEAKLAQTPSSPTPRLSTATPQSAHEALSAGTSATFHIQHDSNFFGHTQVSSRGVVHKKRLLGQSHWLNGGILMLQDLALAIEPYVCDGSSKAVYTIRKCKAIARHIKARRTPEWPAPPMPDLPAKDVADELVECYLRTIETVYRILHIPTFRREYEKIWVSNSSPDPTFLVKLKLVLALGSLTYDEGFSLRNSASSWVYQAHTWASGPRLKIRFSIDAMQIHLLLLLAREMVAHSEAIWIAAGSLVRMAMYMGLHRDPALFPRQSTYSAEMRRRLWNTTLELCLQSAMTSGGPPLVSLQDFDTQPPGNFDDDQLTTEEPIPRPEREFTQMTVARALRKTVALRIAVTKYLNDTGCQTKHEDALRLEKELRASHRNLAKTLVSCGRSSSASTSTSSPFAFRVADLIMHRYILSLHIPFLDRALHDSAYAYSRKAAVDCALKIWCAAFPASSIVTSRNQGPEGEDAILARLIKCGTGFFRYVSFQSIVIVALELRAQIRENDGLGPAPLRRDLLSMLEEGKTWSIQCIEVGETSVKGYLLYSLMLAWIEALMQGASKEELQVLLLKAAEEAGDTGLRVLQGLAEEGPPGGVTEELDDLSWTTPGGLFSDVEFMISNHLFDATGAEQMNWIFNDETQPLWQ